MLCTWLVEIMLHRLENSQQLASPGPSTSGAMALYQPSGVTVQDLEDFILTYRSSLDPATTYTLLGTHGQRECVLFFAEVRYLRMLCVHTRVNVSAFVLNSRSDLWRL
jgi:hypothetical protein